MRIAFVLFVFLFLLCSTVGCSLVPQPSVKVIAFGDSSTVEYPIFLPELLGVPANQISNQYKSGEGTSNGLKRLQDFAKFKTFPNAQYLLYWEGGNDLIDFVIQIDPLIILDPTSPTYPFDQILQLELNRIRVNVQQAIGLAREQNWTITLATYPDIQPMICPAVPFLGFLLPQQAEIANKYQHLLNDVLRDVAAANVVQIVDVDACGFAITQYKNCNHLNSEGNKIVAQMWATNIHLR